MKSGDEISAAHLETIRRRRMRRIRRQRAIEVGKPVDVSLKPMALNSPQQKELSNLNVRPQVVRKHGIMTPKRVYIMAAVGLHLIAVLLAAHYVVWPTRLDAEATTVEIVHLVPPHRVRQPICNLGGDNYPRDGCLTPNPSPWGLDDRDRSFGPTPPDAFVTLEVTRRPTWLKKIEPKYPRTARLAQKEGKVVLEATIDVDGKAKDIKIKEDKVGFGCAEAAVEALKASRFIPATRGDERVPIRIVIPYQFKLKEKVTRVNRQQTRLNQGPPRTPVEGNRNRAKKVEDGCW